MSGQTDAMESPIVLALAAIDLDALRIFLHLLGVSGWVGGQIVMLGLLPMLRTLGAEVPHLAAMRFGRIAWPCFGLVVATGIWSLAEVGVDGDDTEYLAGLLVKLFLVGLSGASALVHTNTRSRVLRGVTGGLGFLGALGALLTGSALAG